MRGIGVAEGFRLAKLHHMIEIDRRRGKALACQKQPLEFTEQVRRRRVGENDIEMRAPVKGHAQNRMVLGGRADDRHLRVSGAGHE